MLWKIANITIDARMKLFDCLIQILWIFSMPFSFSSHLVWNIMYLTPCIFIMLEATNLSVLIKDLVRCIYNLLTTLPTCSNDIYCCLSDDNCKNIVEYLIGVLYNETKARLAYFAEYNVNIRNILLVQADFMTLSRTGWATMICTEMDFLPGPLSNIPFYLIIKLFKL